MKHRDNGRGGKVWTTTHAEMRAYDQLPIAFRDFLKTARTQWACVPMLRRLRKYKASGHLLSLYQAEDI